MGYGYRIDPSSRCDLIILLHFCPSVPSISLKLYFYIFFPISGDLWLFTPLASSFESPCVQMFTFKIKLTCTQTLHSRLLRFLTAFSKHEKLDVTSHIGSALYWTLDITLRAYPILCHWALPHLCQLIKDARQQGCSLIFVPTCLCRFVPVGWLQSCTVFESFLDLERRVIPRESPVECFTCAHRTGVTLK